MDPALMALAAVDRVARVGRPCDLLASVRLSGHRYGNRHAKASQMTVRPIASRSVAWLAKRVDARSGILRPNLHDSWGLDPPPARWYPVAAATASPPQSSHSRRLPFSVPILLAHRAVRRIPLDWP
jgi:hypothetical protein